MESFGTIDLLFAESEYDFNPERVLVFVQGESGFLPWIIGRGVQGGLEPSVEILSSFMDVEVFNMVPNTVPAGWLVTQVDEVTAVVNITTWFPTVPMPDSNHGMWSRTYPAMRDLVLWLRSRGCIDMTFMTALNTQRVIENAGEDGIYVQDFEDDEGETIPLMLPAWFIPNLFVKEGGKARIVAVEQDEGLFIDDEALARLGVSVARLGFPLSMESMTKATQHVLANQEEIEAIEGFFNGGRHGEDGEEPTEDWS